MHTEFVKTEGLLNTVNGIFCMQIVSEFNGKGTLNKIISNSFYPVLVNVYSRFVLEKFTGLKPLNFIAKAHFCI
jgi:uncharacterized protein YqkB